LTQREIQFAQTMPDFFGQRLQKIGMQTTGQGSFYDQIRKLLPEVGQRAKTAQAELAKVNNQFQMELKLNPKETADQLAKAVLPQLDSAMKEVERRVAQELARFSNQQQANRRSAMAGGSP
jgi:hypothetical protein